MSSERTVSVFGDFYKHRVEEQGAPSSELGAEAATRIMAILGWVLVHHQAPRPSS